MSERHELGQFLQSRRARLQPEQAGLPARGRRRVAGLRRQEVGAIARALQLDEDERSHLWALAHPVPGRRRPERSQRVRPQLQQILDHLDLPAVVIGRRMDVLAWNLLGDAVYGVGFDALPQKLRNWPRLLFLGHVDPRALYPDWDRSEGAEIVAYLRLDAGRHPDDPAMAALVGELSMHSADFRRWWAAHDVREKASGQKRIRHPLVGELHLAFETLRLADDPDQALIIQSAEPDSPTAEALRLLAGWAATPATADNRTGSR